MLRSREVLAAVFTTASGFHVGLPLLDIVQVTPFEDVDLALVSLSYRVAEI